MVRPTSLVLTDQLVTRSANSVNHMLIANITESDLPRISPMLNVHEGTMARRPSSQVATSLPSFASFSEHAAARSDETDTDGPEIAPMVSRLPCHPCNQLQPMVQEVAVAIAELDQNIQSLSSRSAIKVCALYNSIRQGPWHSDSLTTSSPCPSSC